MDRISREAIEEMNPKTILEIALDWIEMYRDIKYPEYDRVDIDIFFYIYENQISGLSSTTTQELRIG